MFQSEARSSGEAARQRLLDLAVERRPLAADGKSGAMLERVRLADGRRLVAKHVDARRDWIMQATGDTGRVVRLWTGGVLAQLPPVIDHTIISVEREGDRWVLLMRDVSDALFADHRRLSRADGQRLLATAADMHTAFRDRRAPDGLTPLGELYRFLSPQAARSYAAIADVPGWRSGDGPASPSSYLPTSRRQSRTCMLAPRCWPMRSFVGAAPWCTAI